MKFMKLLYHKTLILPSLSGPQIAILKYGALMRTNGSLRDGLHLFPTPLLTPIFRVSTLICRILLLVYDIR